MLPKDLLIKSIKMGNACMRPDDARYARQRKESERKIKVEKPKMITICGSSRFIEQMAVLGWLLEKEEGAIVMSLNYLPHWYGADSDHQGEKEGVAEAMDELHLRKIDLSDEIFVVDVDKYIGRSTQREIEYAEAQAKVIRLYSCEKLGAKIEHIYNDYIDSQGPVV